MTSNSNSENVWNLASNCTKKISTYGWDQTEKYVNIYVSISGTEINIQSYFNGRKMGVFLNVDGVEQSIAIPNLCGDITPEKCKIKQKPARFIIKIKKSENGAEWSDLTDAKDKKEAARKKRIGTTLKDASTQELLADMYSHATDEERAGLREAAMTGQKKREAKK